MAERPTVVCLCGSTRFYEAFQRADYEETMAGRIVLSVGFYHHSAEEVYGEAIGCTPEQKARLDGLHLRKLDLADEVLVLNVGGYGESTTRELAYALQHGKVIRYLEVPAAPASEVAIRDAAQMAAEREYLIHWAYREKCVFEEEGEVGFGRECVGMVRDSSYVDLGPHEKQELLVGRPPYWVTVPIEESKPPEGVTDAYQKHDCLCVIGGGDGAVHQLYLWCWALERRGVHVSPWISCFRGSGSPTWRLATWSAGRLASSPPPAVLGNGRLCWPSVAQPNHRDPVLDLRPYLGARGGPTSRRSPPRPGR